MKFFSLRNLLTICMTLLVVNVFAQCSSKKDNSVVKASAVISSEKDIVDVAASNENFATLVAAVKAAGLVDALKDDGPFTVFAPVNSAFDKLPEGTVATLLKPENKDQLTKILTYHVVSGKLDSKAVLGAIKSNGGTAEVTTLSGGKLKAMLMDGGVVLKDENGTISKVTAVDVAASNGVIHVIDTVVLPK